MSACVCVFVCVCVCACVCVHVRVCVFVCNYGCLGVQCLSLVICIYIACPF